LAARSVIFLRQIQGSGSARDIHQDVATMNKVADKKGKALALKGKFVLLRQRIFPNTAK
jgi:hypothetical protein